MHRHETDEVLIWGKTYPELSNHHRETVCTGGCLRDGTPIRIYPVPLRYLKDPQKYSLYDWIRVPLAPSGKDARPESFKVRPGDIEVIAAASSSDGWAERWEILSLDRSWHYDCLEDLKVEQKESGKSLGLIRVGRVTKIEVEERSEEDQRAHEEKLEQLKAQGELFAGEMKDLEFVPYRIRLHWHCARMDGEDPCPIHTASILDWGTNELIRKEGIEKAVHKVESVTDLRRHDLRLFMGNLKSKPWIFSIVGLWYPLRRDIAQEDLFRKSR